MFDVNVDGEKYHISDGHDAYRFMSDALGMHKAEIGEMIDLICSVDLFYGIPNEIGSTLRSVEQEFDELSSTLGEIRDILG